MVFPGGVVWRCLGLGHLFLDAGPFLFFLVGLVALGGVGGNVRDPGGAVLCCLGYYLLNTLLYASCPALYAAGRGRTKLLAG